MRSQRGSEQETELKHYYIISDHQHRMKKEQTILDAILENENIIFSAAIILSAVANGRFGRFASTMSWQIIAPALVMKGNIGLYVHRNHYESRHVPF